MLNCTSTGGFTDCLLLPRATRPRALYRGEARCLGKAYRLATAVFSSILLTCVIGAQVVAADQTNRQPRVDDQAMLRDGDRVVLLGEGFLEREGQQGIIETALTIAHPDARLEFRNLGWNGDTVWAESRGVFDSPAEGYRRMLTLVRELEPSVIVVAYGRNESYAGPDGLAAFHDQLTTLCNDVAQPAPAKGEAAETSPPPRLVLVTPLPFLKADTCPDAEHRNRMLADYAAAIREVAAARNAPLIDLFAAFPRANDNGLLSRDGIQLTPTGYEAAAGIMVAATEGSLASENFAEFEPVRQLVAEKNELFFHRWRPANETYLFLFRRHEQGNNAVEIPQFDPLIAEAEGRIRDAVKALR